MHQTDEQIRISVRSLVEFVLRTGDLDNRRGKNAKDAMAQGSRIHRKIQKQMGAGYRAEVSLKKLVRYEDVTLILEGRADGVFQDQDGVAAIDEIKGIYGDLNRLEEPVPVHQAQAVCYGYMYALDNDLPGMNIQITYCNLESEEIKRFIRYYDFAGLEEAVLSWVADYAKWARFQRDHREQAIDTIRQLEFPYPYREGQRELVVSIYRVILKKTRLFIQAPTGIGKTMAALFPAVKAMGEGLTDKIFYLTAKTITRSVAEEAFRILGQEPLPSGFLGVSSVTLTAKEKLCPLVLKEGRAAECNPDACPYAKGHFDRVNQAVYDLITHKLRILREDILEYAEKYQVCPFEMNLDVSNWTDAIICDYNYVFDPHVRLIRYFGENIKGNYLFLVDEAHNLVERAREMYSAALIKEDFLESSRHYGTKSKKLSKRLKRCNGLLLDLKRQCQKVQLLAPSDIAVLLEAADQLFSEISDYYENHPDQIMDQEETEFFFGLRDFILVGEGLDENYQIYTELLPDGKFLLKLYCVNTSKRLREAMDQGISTIFYSATLLPVRYYKGLLSGEEEDYAIYAHSPFASSNRLLGIGRDVTTRYKTRDEAGYRRVAEYVLETVKARAGNYMVFCPSYAYLSSLYQALELCMKERQAAAGEENPPDNTDLSIFVQEQYMSEEKREAFLKQFSAASDKTQVGLCIMGGIFSEGIDLKEDRLIGVIVVGTGLPQVCTQREILKGYYDRAGKDGFAYAYLYPGMNKVQQAAGRLIRTKNDRGVILLLDYRFLNREYLEQFPREWDDYRIFRLEDVGPALGDFWKTVENR